MLFKTFVGRGSIVFGLLLLFAQEARATESLPESPLPDNVESIAPDHLPLSAESPIVPQPGLLPQNSDVQTAEVSAPAPSADNDTAASGQVARATESLPEASLLRDRPLSVADNNPLSAESPIVPQPGLLPQNSDVQTAEVSAPAPSTTGNDDTAASGQVARATESLPEASLLRDRPLSVADNGPLSAESPIVPQPGLLPQNSQAGTAEVSAPAPSTTGNDTVDSLPQIQDYALENSLQGQVTSVSQLSDVKPTDWAFQALQSLVERYGCIAGYPDGTYRGNRALTRFEFAAGLNACLDRVNELIATGTANLANKEDLVILQKLQEEFAAELATLRGRVDALEARTANLESNQFSTTTKLNGYVLFNLVNAFGADKKADGSGPDVDDGTIFSDRVRLILTSSFTGKDKLIIRLQAGNTPSFADATGTRMANLAFQDGGGNSLKVNQLEYRFPLGDRGTFFLEAYGFLDLFVPTLHPLDGDYDTVLTGFALRSPIYFPSGVSGAGFNYNLTDKINIGGGYLAGNPTANNPSQGEGLFNGPYGALAQVTFRPTSQAAIAFTYLNAYDDGNINAPAGGYFGSKNSAQPFGTDNALTHGYGVEAQYAFSRKFILSGWYYLANTTSKSGVTKGADATVQSWAVALAFPDLLKEGNLGGITLGMPSKVTSNDVSLFEDRSTSFMVDAFYRYQINDFIAVTPGLVMITNPDHNSGNDTVFIGVIRTSFSF
ncbi:iron uptake porin [Microcoleus vaginatus DQ-U2]|uniref:iron uptake porin n=1 Tax=Microcoleus vaginatus TaxID=119532 RepID=UPI001683BC41|nr:iron uptake porin [Microcoleus sp. FACHB-DQ6]